MQLGLPFLLLLSGVLIAIAAGYTGLRRLPIDRLAMGLALLPLAAFGWILALVPDVQATGGLVWQVDWITAVDLKVGFYLDALGALFALLVTGIGSLVVLYAGQYFKGDQTAWRFIAYLLSFMIAMLGIVMSGDVISLFVFWEGTSIISFLLVAYKYKYAEARSGAFKALFITGGGGIALLVGLLMISYVVGSTDLTVILQSGDVLRQSNLYLAMLGLVALGAFTKSAQFPLHIWLPDAMSAPTPASAYLHSATMVKAGIFLLARLNPVLGQTEAWFWLLSTVGMLTMLTGAYLGMKQHDLKALLAYSTISQLGILVMLIGQDTEIAFKALVVGVVAHALYKSALFLIAGIVDHEAGTRDLRRLGGLRKVMPFSFVLVSIAALSMAGLPPLFGFLAKETLLATAVHPSLPVAVSWVFSGAVVVAAAFKLVQSGLVVVEGFMGQPKDTAVHPHEAPRLMLLAPAIPALLSLAIGILPEPKPVAEFFGKAAEAAHGSSVKVSFALWTGLYIPLFLSILAISAGAVLFWQRDRFLPLIAPLGGSFSFNKGFAGVINGIDWAAYVATRLQYGRLRTYLTIILLSMVGLILLFAGVPWPSNFALTWPALASTDGAIQLMRLISLAIIVGTSLATILLRRDLFAIFALGISGFGAAVFMLLEPAPDIALVQIVVDILAMVILVLTLTRLPREQRRKAQDLTFPESRLALVRDVVTSAVVGLVVTGITLSALVTRPRSSVLTPFFEESAKPLAGATDIVGAIIVDFRALDTLIEIAVFGMAGVGIYTLLRYATKKHKDTVDLEERPSLSPVLPTLGIGGTETSSLLHVLAYVALPISSVIAMTHMMYGHDSPGDGFTAGVIISLVIGFWYLVFGYVGTRQRLRWLNGGEFVGAGLLLAIGNGLLAMLIDGSFLGHVNYGGLAGIPLPAGFSISSAFFFEAAICLTVLGSVIFMLNTLGRPEGLDALIAEAEKEKTAVWDSNLPQPENLPQKELI